MKYHIKLLPPNERPREKLQTYGHESLSNAELVAILLGSGTKQKSVLQLAHELVAQFGTLKNLAEASVEELCQIHGLGRAKAVLLKAAFGLGVKLAKQPIVPKYKVEIPDHAYHLVKEDLERRRQEAFMVILLDAKSFVMSQHVVTLGTMTEVLVHPREVFYPAVRHKAVSLIVAHNHPSGDPTPSSEDCEVTLALANAGKLLNIPLLDHIIIGEGTYVSMRKNQPSMF